ncbi:T9SS type A sorting domain-containing protein [Mangrovimonas yunxiaonensis]|nr:T9SS type A sorting domain-containing protein [Mangrovimonas yunxiaonensis]
MHLIPLGVFMWMLFIGNQAYSQIIVESGTTSANFGVDADVQTNGTSYIYNENGILQPSVNNTDDWFQDTPMAIGSGQGVIDVSTLPDVNGNTSFELGMAPGTQFEVINNALWLDAVFIRDPHYAGNQDDFSIFKGGSNKNADNPASWNIITGSNPAKNDIIDAMAHLRREVVDQTNPFGGDLWAFIGASTRSADGSAYLDFELFRSEVSYDTATNQLTGTGDPATGNHTAWEFDANGHVSSLGDMIIALDFENGGVEIIGHIYVWINPNNLPGGSIQAYNSLVGTGQSGYNFRFVIGGNGQPIFESGDLANGYGYAEIELYDGTLNNTVAFATMNGGDVDASEFGTKFGPQANNYDVYAENSFVEFGLNLTQFGLDATTLVNGDCQPLFGGVMIKTRSSASFTSELKDLAGPFPFGNIQETEVEITGDDLECNDESTTLTAVANVPFGLQFEWYNENDPNTILGTTNELVVYEPGFYTVVVTAPGINGPGTGCSSSYTKEVIEIIPPVVEVSCPSNNEIQACATNEFIAQELADWFDAFTYGGGQGELDVVWTADDEVIDPETYTLPTFDSCTGGIVTIGVTVTDECEQVESCEATFTVLPDDAAPTGTAPQGEANHNGCVADAETELPFDADTIAANYSDNCGQDVTVNLTGTEVTGTDCAWTLTYTYEVVDNCGNALEGEELIHNGSDQDAPTGTAPQGEANHNGCMADAESELPFDADAVALNYTDDCNDVTVNLTGTAVTGTDCAWTLTYTYEVVDNCGNALEGEELIHNGSDQDAPTGTAPQGEANHNGCMADAESELPFDADAVALNYTDDCNDVTVNLTGTEVTGTDCAWTLTYTYEVVDNCGNALEGEELIHNGSDQDAPTGTAPQGEANHNGCMADAESELPFDADAVALNYTDDCNDVTVNLTGTAVTGTDCAWTLTYTYEVVDNCGNALEGEELIHNGSDQDAPTGTAPQGEANHNGCMADAESELPFDADAVALNYTDDCNDDTVNLTGTAGTGTDCAWTLTHTYEVVDNCGNALEGEELIHNGSDQDAPTGTAPQGEANHNGCMADAETELPFDADAVALNYTDDCNDVTVNLTGTAVTGTDCAWTLTYTYEVVDNCGNALEGEELIHNGSDQDAPTGTAPQGEANHNGCMADAETELPFDADAVALNYTDDCNDVTVNLTGTAVTGTDCAWTLTYTYEVVDNCGNALEGEELIHNGSDQDAPTGTAPQGEANHNGCMADAESELPFDADAVALNYTDDCNDVTVNLTGTEVTGTDCAWTLTYTYEVVDNCGNALEGEELIHNGSDQNAPTGTAPQGEANHNGCMADAESELPFDADAVALNYTDDCNDVTVNLTGTEVTGTDCAWTLTYTYEVVDNCGNALEGEELIHNGSDQDAPTGTAPQGEANHNGCMADAESELPFDAEAVALNYTDDCNDVTVNLTGTAVTGTDCAWTLTYTYEVVDNCGNALEGEELIHNGSDQDAPTGTAPQGEANHNGCMADAESELPFDADAVALNYTDDCNDVAVNLTGTEVTGTDCAWTLTYTYEVVDNCGNALEGEELIHNGSDQDAPTGTAPQGEANHNGCMADAESELPFDADAVALNYTDDCNDVTVNLTGTAVTGTDCAWTLTYTYEVVDNCGNALEGEELIHNGSDQDAPTGTAPQGEANHNGCMADAESELPFDADAVALNYTDDCNDVTVNLTGTAVTGTDCAWTLTYTYEVVDNCGNALEGEEIIHNGSDQTDPVITLPQEVETTLCNDAFPATLTANWTDNCASGGTLTVSGSNFIQGDCVQYQDYVFTATDDCGNSVTETITIERYYDEYDNCETAFGMDPNGNSNCFIEDGFSRWGWYNHFETEGIYTIDLYAGAAHCDADTGTHVGVAEIAYLNGEVTVTYMMNSSGDNWYNYVMNEAHVYVGCDPYPVLSNGAETVAPGQYTVVADDLDHVTTYTVGPIAASGPINVIVHAVTCEVMCHCSPWNTGEFIPDPNSYDAIDCAPEADGGDDLPAVRNTTFTAYPVPFEHEVNIAYQFDYDTNVRIDVYDVKGTLVTSLDNIKYVANSLGTTKIDLSRANDQMYFVRLTTDKGVLTKKIVSSSSEQR